jgi:hypothetical protein
VTDEVWKDIPSLENYQASNLGNIRYRGHAKRKLHLSNSGYLYVGVRNNGKFMNLRVHRLVAETFLPKIDGKGFINHIDGDKTNNSVDNLEWCTASENEIHKARVLGKKQTPPVNVSKVIDLDTGVVYESVKEAAEATGADRHHIGEVASGNRKSTRGRHFAYAG